MNRFKQAMLDGRVQIGIFCSITAFQTVEAVAHSGFDYLVFDAEHSPLSLPVLHSQLNALARGNSEAMIRIAAHDPVAIKHYLDLGIQTMMVPSVRSADDARKVVGYTRYPPQGTRGIAGGVRVTRFGRDRGYYAGANADVCLLMQVENAEGLASMEAILAVEGVDGVFFGPNDLAADCGYLAQPSHPDIVAKVEAGIRRTRQLGKAAGILCGEAEYERYRAAGANVVMLGSELGLLVKACDTLAAKYVEKKDPA